MQFISTFKSSILGDPRIILLGSTAYEESIGKRENSSDEEPTVAERYRRH